jgi:hypothetical protein
VTLIAFSVFTCGTVPAMAKPLKFLSLAVVALLSCAAMGADAPKKPLKEGWNKKQMKVFAYACTDGLIQPAMRDYHAAALADGVNMHKPFPEKEFRDSAFPMCLCISERVAETWTLAEVQKQGGMQQARPYVDEALAGGRCKPAGMLGDILQKQKSIQ